MKRCTKCEETKPECEFPWKNKGKKKLATICKVCQRTYKIAYYHRNKETHYERNRKTESKIRDYIQKVKEVGCSLCPETFAPCLEFHHTRDKDHIISKMHKLGSLAKVKEEIAKCVLLCANCHRKVHYNILQVSAIGSQSVSKTE